MKDCSMPYVMPTDLMKVVNDQLLHENDVQRPK